MFRVFLLFPNVGMGHIGHIIQELNNPCLIIIFHLSF